MSAPLPLQGTTNPHAAGYLKRQVGIGNLGVQDQTDDVVASLNSPSASLTTAAAVTPLTEREEQRLHPQPGIVRTF